MNEPFFYNDPKTRGRRLTEHGKSVLVPMFMGGASWEVIACRALENGEAIARDSLRRTFSIAGISQTREQATQRSRDSRRAAILAAKAQAELEAQHPQVGEYIDPTLGCRVRVFKPGFAFGSIRNFF